MITLSSFKKLNIDTSPIGWEPPSKSETAYFCTPMGAKIIGRAGVDGIHYCTVRALGDTIFAVSPMNLPGHNVHPIARNIEELLRLLLACLDMNLIEQAWAWDEEQLTEQIEQVKSSEYFDTAPLDAIREKCGLTPMEKPFEYLYRLQKSYNYAQIPFTDEYYEMMEENAEWQPPEWKVTMDGDFFPERGKGGREIPLNKTFTWGGDTWHIPSAYLCSDGVVVDFFAKLEPEKYLTFYRDAMAVMNRGSATKEDEEKLHRMNPAGIVINPTVSVNGTELQSRRGHGEIWIPQIYFDYLGNGETEDERAKAIVEHYGFDLSQILIIRRCTFPSEAKIGDITSLDVKMVRGHETFFGIHFTSPKVGDTFTFAHPVHGTEHTLTVVEYETVEIDQSKFGDSEFIFPTHMAAIKYTVTPDLPRDEIGVRDCACGDRPQRKETAPKPSCDFCSAVAVIGSSDGPTAIAVGAPQTPTAHSACSSLYFEKPSSVEWRMSFRVKTVEDMEVELI